jgi:hypothetical protein
VSSKKTVGDRVLLKDTKRDDAQTKREPASASVPFLTRILYVRRVTKRDGDYLYLCIYNPQRIRMYFFAFYNVRLESADPFTRIQGVLSEYQKGRDADNNAVEYHEATDQELTLFFGHWRPGLPALRRWYEASKLFEEKLSHEEQRRMLRIIREIEEARS